MKPDMFTSTLPGRRTDVAPRIATVIQAVPEPDEWAVGTQPIDAQGRLLRVGETVAGLYRVSALLGSGGMGEVYEVQDLALGRKAALKIAWPGVADTPLVREARMLAAFDHESIVRVHGLVLHGDRPCMVMERLLGNPLSRRVCTRVDVADVVVILLRIAEGLQVLHSAKVTHRDLKPDNIMMTARGRVVLMDLGIARYRGDCGEQQLVSGSLPYMAPEVFANSVRESEAHLVDIYALGITAYELLTGRVPYDSEDVADAARDHWGAPVPDVRRAREDVPDALARLVAVMMAKRPGERPTGIDEVSTALARVLDRMT